MVFGRKQDVDDLGEVFQHLNEFGVLSVYMSANTLNRNDEGVKYNSKEYSVSNVFTLFYTGNFRLFPTSSSN